MTHFYLERTTLPFTRFAASSLIAIAFLALVLTGCDGSNSKPAASARATPAGSVTASGPAASATDPAAAPADGGDDTAMLFKTR